MKQISRFLLGPLAVISLAIGPLCADDSPPIQSPEALWEGFDPAALPLETAAIRNWTEPEGVYETLRFTGVEGEAFKVRVFAIQGAPLDQKNCPGILHVHGGGQTGSIDWVRFWVKRGYVCVSFDFCGDWQNRTDFTHWGPIRHANMAHAAGGFQLHPSPRESSWYHWAVVARRALTLLSRHPAVDPNRLGMFGISVGGSLAWKIAAFDHRLKAAVPIYGCGYNQDRRNAHWGYSPPSDDQLLFQRVLSPEAHAPFIACPVLFLNATNDFHGIFDRAFETLAAVPADVRQSFTPRFNHHIAPAQGKNLTLWMDWHLKDGPAFPETPRIALALDSTDALVARICPDRPDEVQSVDCYYTLGDRRPPTRFWRSASVHHEGAAWSSPLPVHDAWDEIRVFANVTYASGVCLSSQMEVAIPGQLGKARATLAWSALMPAANESPDHWYFTRGYTDPIAEELLLETGLDPTVGPFVGFPRDNKSQKLEALLSTHIVGDAQYRGRSDHSLAFSVSGEFSDDGLTATLITDEWTPRARRYMVSIPAADLGPDWHDVVLPAAKFLDSDGTPLANWQQVDKLELAGRAPRANPPRFARLRWEAAETSSNPGD